MTINSQKLLPGSTFSTVNTGVENVKKQADPKLNIYKKVVKIDKLLKSSFLLQSKEQTKQRKDLENQKREKREKDLEAPKKFKGFQLLKNALPKTGFLDAIKRFILFTFAGWLFTNLFQFLPKLLGFVKIITPVISWFEKGIGALFEGIVTFIDLGYKAYDSVKSFAKTIGGEKFAEKFDALSGALNTMLNLAFIAAMSYGAVGGFGKGGRGGIKGGKPPAPTGKPRVTTSGGGAAGRPDIRNPLRQKPRITGSGGAPAGKPDIRNPLRQKPRITGSAGAGKVAGKGLGKFAGKLPIVGPLIDFGIRRLIFKEPLGKAAAGAVGAGAGQALGGMLGGSLGGIVGSVVPVAGTLLGAGAGSLVGSVIGGFIGDWIGVSLYDFIEAQKDIKTKKMNSGGKVSSSTTGKKKRKGKLKRRQEILERLRPGKDIGGEKEIEKIYPNPERKFFGITLPNFEGLTSLFFGGKDKKKDGKKYPNAIKTLLDVGNALGTSGDWIGSLMRAGVQVALGQKPDAKSLAKTVSSVLQNVTDPAIKGIKSISRELLGFAAGGEVSSSILSFGDTLSLERSIEANLRNKFDDAIGSVRTQSRKKGEKITEPKPGAEPPIPGRESMIEENIQRGRGGSLTSGKWGPLLDLISSVESAGGSYDSRYGGIYPGYSKLTIAQADAVQRSNYKKWGSAASGKYQFMNIAGQAAYAGLKPTDLFSPENQDKMAIALIEKKRYGRDWMSGKISDPEFAKYLAMEWAGLPRGKDNLSYYDGDGRNKAHTTFDKVLATLSKVKKGGYSKEELSRSTDKKNSKESKPGFNLLKPSTWFGQGADTKDKEKDTKDTKPGKLGKGYGSDGVKIAGDLGTFMKANKSTVPVLGSIHQHPQHPPLAKRGYDSYHNVGRAIDLGGYSPSSKKGGYGTGKDEQAPIIKSLIEWNKKNNYSPVQLIHASPKYKNFGEYREYPDVHHHHVHAAYQGGGLVSPSKPNVNVPNSFASYNDPRKSSTLAVQPVIVEKMMPFPVDSPIAFPSGGSSGVNNSVLPSLMQG